MSGVPILKLGDHLIVTLTPQLSDSQWDRLRDSLLAKVGKVRATGAVIDVSAMEVMDSFATRTLGAIALMMRLRGARCVVVGISPEVAYTMAQLGLKLHGTKTALDLEEGLALLHAEPGPSA
ncbi:MAG: STAS domain-containing protein [Myxococcota bacterium]